MTFTENWFSVDQASLISGLAYLVKDRGLVVEIGCWEGKSTYHIANAIYPTTLYAIDTWRGNEDESMEHPSVIAAKERNVYQRFNDNMAALTQGNVIAIQSDWRDALALIPGPVGFLHIDAAHDYVSVFAMLVAWYPCMIKGGIICGDDFKTADASRADLGGGVELAVRTFFTDRTIHSEHNAWWVYV